MCRESAVATGLGVSARLVTNARVKNLARGEDWELIGQEVCLTEAAVARLASLLDQVLSVAATAVLIEKSRRTPVAAFDAKVSRFPVNRHLLTVTWREGELERRADILVTKRENFRLGMVVPIRLNAAQQRYELARPAPRMKGRW